MAYMLEDLAADCHQALKDDPGPAGRRKIAEYIQKALADKEFVASQFPPENDTERKIIYEDPEFKFCILAHVYTGAKSSQPHDHATSWAIYGQATGVTEMTEWHKVKAPEGDKPGLVAQDKVYDLKPGMAVYYDVGQLHSPRREDTTRLIRVEGVNLAGVKRDKYEVAA